MRNHQVLAKKILYVRYLNPVSIEEDFYDLFGFKTTNYKDILQI